MEEKRQKFKKFNPDTNPNNVKALRKISTLEIIETIEEPILSNSPKKPKKKLSRKLKK